MRFVYDETKTAQAAAHLIELEGGKIEFLKLIKLLYLADRKAFIERGYPISGDRWVSLGLGPVLSRTYEHIKEKDAVSPWHRYISDPSGPSGHWVTVQPTDEPSRLSRNDVKVLDDIYGEFGNRSATQLVSYTHEHCPEWHDPGRSMIPIDPAEVLISAGFDDEDIADLSDELDELYADHPR